VIYHLNRWIEKQSLDGAWSADPLVSTLPQGMRESDPALASLAATQFYPYDAEFLLEAHWMRSLSDWVSRREDLTPPELKAWLDRRKDSISESSADQLEIAGSLFDWTIRNVQLEAMPAAPDPQAGANASGATAAEGAPGPGYRRPAWKAALFGYGDAWERARVFILLCRQQGIEVVMLATSDAGQPRPWLPAALIDGELYLFDPNLGLPLPCADGQGVATLKQAKDDPRVLDQLDIGQEYDYPTASRDLKEMFVLIDASYGYLSRRMQTLESALTGGDRMVLSVAASSLGEQAAKAGSIAADRVRLWTVPHEAIQFRRAILARSETDRAVQQGLAFDEALFERPDALVEGRLDHLRGEFDSREGKPGAKENYLEARKADELIAQLSRSVDLQRQFGIVPTEREQFDPQTFQARLLTIQAMLTLQKHYATHWLGLVQYDEGKHASSQDWFKREVPLGLLQGMPIRNFREAADYNLARAYERMGESEKARQIYLQSESPQRHGNLLRARMLRQASEQKPESDPNSESATSHPDSQ
jgi:hypothetical protein